MCSDTMSISAADPPLSAGRGRASVLVAQARLELGRLQAKGLLIIAVGAALKAEEPMSWSLVVSP